MTVLQAYLAGVMTVVIPSMMFLAWLLHCTRRADPGT